MDFPFTSPTTAAPVAPAGRTTAAGLLVIGYGNTLRQDDGAGPAVAARIEALGLPGVRTLACHQLSPEVAGDIAAASAVVFIDAAAAGPPEVRLRALTPESAPRLFAHAANPASLLAFAGEVYGYAPPAWLVTVPTEQLGFGEDLSPGAQAGVEVAVREVTRLAAELVFAGLA